MGVYIQRGYATQGPAPDGFHVPLNTDRQAVYNIWTALGGGSSDGTNFGIALKLPFAGSRNYSSSNVGGQGSYGRYWSASSYTTNAAYNLNFYSSGLNTQNVSNRAIGFSVRCFKDLPAIPTFSWTKLYGTSIEAGGIFWSSTDGLISLSSDGQTWITIMDKNLGATTVWNNGDTLSEANCGYYYQRGNNYGFPRTGSVTTSSTQVDASNYGPGNYYNSSTFITGSSDRSSVQNDNLWGGEDGNVPAMSELKNAYIGEYVPNFATQGPCPDGFHIPLDSEWQSIINIWTSLGGGSSDGTNFGISLKMPFAGYRCGDSSSVSNQGVVARYSTSNLHHVYRSPSQISLVNNIESSAYSIRPFRNIVARPNSSWTKLYGTSIESGGIFWNSTDGLISLSSDGNTWITIADKNLGATTVWNSGNALSEANCGKYYQLGNNYGFPYTGSVTTSSTRVNASAYGPGNYYNSSTFIIRATSPFTWESSGNMNLRGGVDGNVPV